MYITFIDIKKVIDSVHRESLWKILRAHGIPLKIVAIIRTFYENFECSVIVENTLAEFPVKPGVRQGCVLYPILFLVVIDWGIRKTTPDLPRGYRWTLFPCLEDLDFVDNLAVISATHKHLQEKQTDCAHQPEKDQGDVCQCANCIPYHNRWRSARVH